MIKKGRKYLIFLIVIATILLTSILSIIVHGQVSLLHYINISFYFSSAYIALGLLILVVDKGFFDGISYSFRRTFKKTNTNEDEDDIIPLSELISLPYSQLLYSGLALLSIMLICLMFYY
jgi:hypothetical protein